MNEVIRVKNIVEYCAFFLYYTVKVYIAVLRYIYPYGLLLFIFYPTGLLHNRDIEYVIYKIYDSSVTTEENKGNRTICLARWSAILSLSIPPM